MNTYNRRMANSGLKLTFPRFLLLYSMGLITLQQWGSIDIYNRPFHSIVFRKVVGSLGVGIGYFLYVLYYLSSFGKCA